MLTGKVAFDGSSPASVIAAILERPAPAVRDIAAATLDRVLRTCLEKDPEDRWQSARDLKRELEWIASADRSPVVDPGAVSGPRAWLGWVVAAVLMVAGAAWWWRAPRSPAIPRLKVNLELPDLGNSNVFALSPDGRRMSGKSLKFEI
jgi:hypothetical protein